MTTRTRETLFVRAPFLAALALAAGVVLGAGHASAVIYNTDGAVHDPAQQSGYALPSSYYCIATPSGWTPSATIPDAVQRDDITPPSSAPRNTACTITDTNTKNAIKYSDYPTDTVLRVRDECLSKGYNWSYLGYCAPNNWTTTSNDPRTPRTYYQDHNGCVRCHNTTYMTAAGSPTAAKESYLFGGHRNMSRVADGQKWGMPGVDLTHPASVDLSASAGLNPDGSYQALWIQEDYPRMPVGWTTPLLPALSSLTTAYCAKDGTGTIGSDDVPDLAACPFCESPIMGNGNAGYPLNYPDATSCATAALHTGKPYTWIAASTQPLYWMYGGAGLEGGPAMQQPGSQQYKCGRCHTTGWTANHAADDISARHPQSDFPTVDFKNLMAVGSSTRLLRPSTAGDSATDVSSWDQWGIECSRCHVATDSGHATWPTTSTTGGDIVAACTTCHRMESDTSPRAVAGYNGTTTPIDHNAATPFTNKQQQPDGFAHHPDGPEFLNSAHAKFTGTWGQMGCPPYAINGYGPSITPYAPGAPTECTTGTMNLDGLTASLYASKFAQAAKVDLTGVSDTVAGSCATCHDVHKPLNENTAGMSQSVKTECTACHSNPTATISPQIDLSTINHLGGAGTPLEHAATDPTSACEICHQPPGIKHIWRINTDASYSTYGDYTYAYPVNGSSAAAAAKNVNLSNTAPDGTYTNAVWIDLDNACGQCHGGGVSETDVATTGSVTAGSTDGTHINALTVANVFGFASGKEVTIAGAGWAGADFKTIIAKVVKDPDPAVSGTVYLTYPTVTTVSGAAVSVAGNPTANGAHYRTKAVLATVAKGMHDSAATTYSVTFSTAVGTGANSLQVTATAAVGCTVSCPTFTYDWDWGDSTTDLGSTQVKSHTYGSGGTKSITLTVRTGGKVVGSVKRSVTVTAVVAAPAASGTCSFNADTWTATVTDTSTAGAGVMNTIVTWGDGSKSVAPAQALNHTYITAGAYTVTLKVIDNLLQASGPVTIPCSANPATFTIDGTVLNSGVAAVGSASVTLKKGTTAVAVKYTDNLGAFSAGNLKPGTYTLTVAKVGYTFATPAATVTVGPSKMGGTAITIHATTP